MINIYEKEERKDDKKRKQLHFRDENGEPIHTFLKGFKRYQEDFSNKANSMRENFLKGAGGDVDVSTIKNVLSSRHSQMKKGLNNLDLRELRQKESLDKKELYQLELQKKALLKKQKKIEAQKKKSELEKKMDLVMMNRQGFDRLMEKEMLLEKEGIIDRV